MTDGIETIFKLERCQLVLSCEEEQFARLRDIIITEAQLVEVVGDQRESVLQIFIHHASVERPPARWKDRVVLVTCGVIVAVVVTIVLTIMAAGIQALFG